MADCVFCAIVAREQPAHIVLENDDVIGFLDARPVFPGHTLVVPRAHHETIADLPVPLLCTLFSDVQRMSTAVESAMDAHGTFVAVNNRVSQSVPHVHVHVIPRRFKDGLRGFFWPRLRYADEEEAASVAARIGEALTRT